MRSHRGSRRAARPRSDAGRSGRYPARRGTRGTARCPSADEAQVGRRRLDERRADPPSSGRRLLDLSLGALEQAEELVVVEVAGGRDDDVARDVHRAVVGRDRAAGDRGDHLGSCRSQGVRADGRPKTASAIRSWTSSCGVSSYIAISSRTTSRSESSSAKRRREDHVAHHVDRGLEVVVGDARVDDGVLARSGCVQLAAEPVEDLCDLLRRVRVRALEEQVLDEVRDARALVASRRASRRRSSSRARPSGRWVRRSVITRSPESSSEITYFCTGGSYSCPVASLLRWS